MAGPIQQDLFVCGEDGYPFYRIPALLTAPDGTVLAFCEGRKDDNSDQGGVDVILKRSADGGRTWSAAQIVASDGDHTVGNPCPVVDQTTGVIHLLLCWNIGSDTEAKITDGTAQGTRRIWSTQSADNGRFWSSPRDITAEVKQSDWGWYATGPGVGIQLPGGRLLIPCDHTLLPSPTNFSHVIFSNDGGEMWEIGGTLGPHVNECQAALRSDGSVLLNMRNEWERGNQRAVSVSDDGGATWSPLRYDPALVEPQCQASLIRGLQTSDGDSLLFSNPASTARQTITVRLSRDDGQTWPLARVLHSGPAAYSCLAILLNGSIGCLYERGQDGAGEGEAYDRITFARFSLDWLMETGEENLCLT